MAVPIGTAQTWRAAFTGRYDDEEIDLLLAYFEPGTYILDIGASLGFYTIPLATAVRNSEGRVLAIEPLIDNCDVIDHNLRINGLSLVVDVVPTGLGRSAADVLMHVESGGVGNASIVTGLPMTDVALHDQAGRTARTSEVKVQRLDDLELPSVLRTRRCSVVKIDVEGFEPDLLAGGSEFFGRHRPAIFAEFNPEWLVSRGIPADCALAWAQANHYECFELSYKRKHWWLELRCIDLVRSKSHARRSNAGYLLLPQPTREAP